MTSGRKPFQHATMQQALRRLTDRSGPRRFLVADEVGLGKTLVAQGVIEALAAQVRASAGRPLRVFYMCSSVTIAAQNRRALLRVIDDEEARAAADVVANRLDLLPARPIVGDPPFHLFSLTPYTTAGTGTGLLEERVVIGKALQAVSPSLARRWAFLDHLRHPAGEPSWRDRWENVQLPDSEKLQSFRRRACEALGLSSRAWDATLCAVVEERLAADTRQTVEHLRHALTFAVLDALAPDLVILDEFQRFFEALPLSEPGESGPEGDEEDDGYAATRRVMRAILGAGDKRPALLMLSATPYRLFARQQEGAQHHEELFELLRFLFSDGGRRVRDLRQDFQEYGARLRADTPGSTAVLDVRRRIERTLGEVMCRTERSRLLGDALPRAVEDDAPVDLQAHDLRAFRHLVASSGEWDFGVEPYWSSIPYPLQAMDEGYALRKRAQPAPVAAADRIIRLLPKEIRRYGVTSYAHPKLRRLLELMPGRTAALPWIAPAKPWWRLAGVFEGSGEASKLLVFSRFRAVPRIVSALVSYEAERIAFATGGTGRRPYDYFARSRSGPAKASSARADLRRRPAPTFGLSARGGSGENKRTLAMFGVFPRLAALGDPTSLRAFRSGTPERDALVGEVVDRLRAVLGSAGGAPGRGRTWRWLATIERSSPDWEQTRASYLGAAEGLTRKHAAAASTLRAFADQAGLTECPSESELRELAELALLAPGCIVWRAASRVFGPPKNGQRMITTLRALMTALRPYLDAPELHVLLRRGKAATLREGGHAASVRAATWDGNLEAVVDEYFATLQGLGTTSPSGDRDEEALETFERALAVRDAQVRVQRFGKDRPSFSMRCHAAMPLGLSPTEIASGGEALRSDALRVAFNSSVGQEGLDFHVFCQHIVHWDLPSNPVDLEQRDGRITRYGGLAVRRALAAAITEIPADRSPWHVVAARLRGREEGLGLSPWWSTRTSAITRSVLFPRWSDQADHLSALRRELALYRLAMGQPDQEHLIDALERRLGSAASEEDRRAIWEWLKEATIGLQPAAAG